jgi:DNA-binding transcriptional LysR family regulator
MNLKQLEYIIAIAEEQSIKNAADRLYISQPALSQQLAKLKKEGLPPLFYRKSNKLLLTDAGKIYINGARQILSIWQEWEEEMEGFYEKK